MTIYHLYEGYGRVRTLFNKKEKLHAVGMLRNQRNKRKGERKKLKGIVLASHGRDAREMCVCVFSFQNSLLKK